MTNLIVDASVAVRWFAPGVSADASKAAVRGMALCAPDIILAEVGNALWKAVRAKHLHADIASKHLAKVPELFDDLVPPSRLYEAAFNLGVLLNHPIYDCFYLALARCERSPLVTADKRLAAVARSLADVEVRLLEAR